METAGPFRRPRILLTGTTGQLGWELVRSLWALGEVMVTRRVADRPGVLELDLREPDSIRACIGRVEPDLIVNAGAYTAVDQAESEPEIAMAVNGRAPGIIAEEAARVGAVLVHYSTDYVFDGSGETAWREDDAPRPLNAYGRSKLAGERAIQEVDVPHLIVRTSWVHGVHGNNFVKSMLRLGRNRSSVSVVNDQIGAPTSARLIADVTGLMLAQARGCFATFLRERGGIVHLTCSGATSWHGFAMEIFRVAKERRPSFAVTEVLPIASSDYSAPAIRPKNSRLDCRRLAERFGLIMPTWQAAVHDCLDGILQAEDQQR